MRKALNAATFVALFSVVLFADGLWRPPQNATLPASCTVGDVATKTGTGAGLYECTTTNTWTRVVTATGTPANTNLAQFSGAATVTNGNLSGDVTTSGTLATTIANDAVSYAKIQDVSAASRLLGRGDSGSGNVQELSLGTGLAMSGTTLSVSAVPTSALSTSQATITLTGTQDDVSFSSADLLLLNNASDLTITGLVAGLDGQRLTIMSVGAGHAFLAHLNGGSSSGNQLVNVVTSGVTPLAAGKGWATYQYDGGSDKWRMIQHDQGDWLTRSFDAANFTASGSQTWTVDSGDIVSEGYKVEGSTVWVMLHANGTTVGGTPSTDLFYTLPNSYTISTSLTQWVLVCRVTNLGTTTIGILVMNNGTSATKIGFRRVDSSNWSNSTNNSGVSGMVQVPLN